MAPDEIDSALKEASRAVSEKPHDTAARVTLAALLQAEGRMTEALGVMREGQFFAGGNPDDLRLIAEEMVSLEALPDALAAYAALSRAAPDDPLPHAQSAALWQRLGERGKAQHSTNRAAQLGATGVELTMGDGPTPELCRHLFNDYASRFDAHLMEALDYALPDAIDGWLDRAGRLFAHAIDLGCGTGLAGARLRPRCARLWGVDLSEAMLAEAERKGIYDRLARGEAAGFLATLDERPDLVCAADVLPYIDDAGPLLAAVARRLAPGGIFIFSTEDCDEGWQLRPSRRYAHAPAYIEAAGLRAGLALVERGPLPIRLDHGKPVHGGLYAMARLE